MEEAPRGEEQIVPEVTHSDRGLDIAVARRYTWHFTDSEEARHYFRRRHVQFTALRWGLRALVLSGIADIAHGIDQTVKTHDAFTGAGVLIVSGLSLIIEGLNERTVGERVRLHRAIMRRFPLPEE